jgi:hypothetical protein
MRIDSAGLVDVKEDMLIGSAGNGALLYLNDSANTKMSNGITIHQGGADDEILTFKSSDVGHAMTAISETDTWLMFKKRVGASGGAQIEAFSDGNEAMYFRAMGSSEDTTDTTTSTSAFATNSAKTDGGVSITAQGSTANIVGFTNNGTARVLIKGDGTVHASDTSWATALDDLPDAVAGRALVTQRTEETGGGVLAGYKINAPQLVDVLEKRGIVTAAEGPENGHEGHRFLNLQKATKFSWDMGFQNFLFLWHVVKEVMTPEQIDRLPAEFKAGIDLLEA